MGRSNLGFPVLSAPESSVTIWPRSPPPERGSQLRGSEKTRPMEVVDQALRLRELAAESRGGSMVRSGLDTQLMEDEATAKPFRILAVTSGKGGVGKTNFAINFATALRRLGKRVAVLDADLGLANVTVALGIQAETNLHDVVQGRVSMEEIVLEGPEGVLFVPGGSAVPELADLDASGRERLLTGLQDLRDQADILLIDTAAGLSKNVTSFACAADSVFVVTIPEPPAIADAYGMIKALLSEKPEIDLRLVVNRTLRRHEGRAVFEKLDLVVRRFLGSRLNYLGCLPDDPAVPLAVRAQKPFVMAAPEADVTRDLMRLAEDFLESDTKGQGLSQFFRRLMRWFR